MTKIFRYSTPLLGEFLLGKNVKEYHVYYEVPLNFEKAYRDHNKNRFISDVYRYIATKYEDIIQAKGIDQCYDDGETIQYVYVHLDAKDCSEQIKKIISDLEEVYKTDWCKYQVPKLVSIVSKFLENSRLIAQAVSHYQDKHGFDATQRALYVLHNDIIPYDYSDDDYFDDDD